MLVLSRREGEQIVVPECGLTVTVLRILGNRVRLGVSASPSVSVHRKEVAKRIAAPGADHPAVTAATEKL